jgi:preprotein translocase subunit Sec63
MAIVDGRDKMPLVRQHLLSDAEAAEWFKTHEVSELTIFEADSKATPQDRLKHYQGNATELTKEMFDRYCKEKMSDGNIKTFLQADAKAWGVGAEVIYDSVTPFNKSYHK